ncbi:STM3941 family protein [Paenibacillus sp. RC84]|uniref:STM3941 family protein n=1 Tax=Paenibacillus sp. RC84 TaxID=3156252 RepID=UPI003512F4DF
MQPVHQPNDLIIYPSTKKTIGLALAALVFVVLGVVFIGAGQSEEERSLGLVGIGGVSVVFFGACLVYLVYRLFNRKPSLIVNDEGIVDHSSAIGGGELRWADIEEIMLYDYMGQRFIGIRLHDTETYLARQSGFKKALMKANQGLVQATVNITQTAVKMPLEELYELMMEKWERDRASA